MTLVTKVNYQVSDLIFSTLYPRRRHSFPLRKRLPKNTPQPGNPTWHIRQINTRANKPGKYWSSTQNTAYQVELSLLGTHEDPAVLRASFPTPNEPIFIPALAKCQIHAQCFVSVTSFNSHTSPGGDINHIHFPEEKLQRSDTCKWPGTSNWQSWDLEMDCYI